MEVLDLVTLTPLMERTRGRPEIAIGLVDGPIVKDHPDFEGQNIRELPGATATGCSQLERIRQSSYIVVSENVMENPARGVFWTYRRAK
jgi:hypothetical protein